MRMFVFLANSHWKIWRTFVGHYLKSKNWVFALENFMDSKGKQTVKRLSTMWETRVWSLGWEDPLEKKMAIHFRTIAWKIPWTEELGWLQSMGSQRVGHDWATSLQLSAHDGNVVSALAWGSGKPKVALLTSRCMHTLWQWWSPS